MRSAVCPLGAVDYITKPIRPAIVIARVRTHLELKAARDWLARSQRRPRRAEIIAGEWRTTS
jgi:DNA-binding response OmpR family regulator